MSAADTKEAVPLILFGGTFDPVHRAHIGAARAVSKALGNAKVYFLPNSVPPHRPQPAASAEQRLAMLKIATEPYPELLTDDRELRRPGPSWTIDTLTELRGHHPDKPLVLILGADSLATLHHWHRWQDYPALCHLAVLPRPGAAEPVNEVLQAFPTTDASRLLDHPAGLRLMLSAPFLDVSSSAIRQRLAEKDHCTSLDDAVLAHIKQHGLYTVPNDARPDDEDS
ncbi:nicotinate-nucleotide adenylyltransferase [Alcanivorax sp. 1008]|uniref:nicotinate-nucleotide adenylyltransferase n=1 Tax=Alcanivorax sp. 1008 TaxID=2816853 RepID=UPI001D421C8B|nr:nicotinate-nucleotide adenylyltransferase [Alcanivorax sp. 1008]MCC1497474.1 nicotinate-nucleotide adenylyltransferase [Alcanivorax sp. 1008]